MLVPSLRKAVTYAHQFTSSRPFYHGLMWGAYIAFFMLTSSADPGEALLSSLIQVLFYALGVYFNILYLVPRYLSEKKVFQYLFLLVTTSIVITPLKLFALYIRWTGVPEIQQQLLDTQPSHFLLSLVIVSLSTVLKISSDWVRQNRVRRELEHQNIQTELRFLKSQINPHFLFNTLNSLYALTLKKSDQAPTLVLRLSDMMRYLLYECNEPEVPLKQEINYIQNYMALEQLRHSTPIQLQFEVTGDPSAYRIAPMLFVPFLENAFKHGIGTGSGPHYVRLRLLLSPHQLDFYAENSKPDQAHRLPAQQPGGIGLANIRRRLQILYPSRHRLHIVDTPEHYHVHLQLNLTPAP